MTIGFFPVPRMKRTDRRKGTRSMRALTSLGINDSRMSPSWSRISSSSLPRLGGVSERRIEKAPDAFPRSRRERLGGMTEEAGEGQDGESGRREDEQMALRCEMFKPDGDGSKQ